MAVRELVVIDEERCTGCGDCVTACAEGAIQIVDGKARLVSEIYCDGLGACIGHCPEDAISVVKTEAQPYDEGAVERHLKALDARGGIAALAGPGSVPRAVAGPPPAGGHGLGHGLGHGHGHGLGHGPGHGLGHGHGHGGGGCPGSRMVAFDAPAPAAAAAEDETGTRPSQLRQWPVQLHLVSPFAPYFRGADVLLAADCTAFALGDFHRDELKGKSLAIACPKLDDGREVYLDKLTALIRDALVSSLTVLVMEVPCCSGLVGMARTARERAARHVPIRVRTVSVRGEVIDDDEL